MNRRNLSNSVSRVGFWSGLLTAVWTILFIVFFGAYMSSAPSEWPGLEAFASTFNSGLYLGWVIPTLLLALTFPVLIACIYFYFSDKGEIWGLLGLIFAVMYGAVLTTNYWLLATLVREGLVGELPEGLSWLVVLNPHSVTGAIEGIGYGFMGLAALFAGLAFEGGRLKRWIRRLFIVNGLSGIGSLFLGATGIVMGLWVALGVWVITFPAATILTAVFFKRDL